MQYSFNTCNEIEFLSKCMYANVVCTFVKNIICCVLRKFILPRYYFNSVNERRMLFIILSTFAVMYHIN